MIVVPADGPIPCDLVVLGESPGAVEQEEGRGFVGPSGRVLWKREAHDLGLLELLCRRPRSTCYVTNVCKTPLPEDQWRKLPLWERDKYVADLLAELDAVQPRLVLAFGMRASKAVVPDFTTVTEDHGKPRLGPTRKWIAMGTWHPAAYLRGNHEALGMIVSDLMKVETLLMDGLVELVQPAPVEPTLPEWPETIAFLAFKGLRKSGRCLYCGTGTVAAYEGDGLKWKLCAPHARLTATWAETHLEAMREHAEIAVADSAVAKRDRTAVRMQADLLGARIGRSLPPAPVGGVSADTPATSASGPVLPSADIAAVPGGDDPASVCAAGASESHMVVDDAAMFGEGDEVVSFHAHDRKD